MSSSAPSRPAAPAPHRPDPQGQKPGPVTRQRQGKPFAARLVILAALAILVLGSAFFAPPSALWASIQGAVPEGAEQIASYNLDDVSTQPTQPILVLDVTPTATITEALSTQEVSTPTPSPLPEPTLTAEPTSTATRVIVDTPTSTRTPTPTNTKLPTATHTSTSTAIPSPTVTDPPTATLTPTLQPGIQHVVLISIDGLRPDALESADTPILDDLRARGGYSPNAQTVKVSSTLPSHASMLCGTTLDKHGLLLPLPYIGWPGINGPTLFDMAHEAGLTTAAVTGKKKLDYVISPDTVDEFFCADAHDAEVKEHAVELIQAGMPDLLFVHFPDTDRVGHEFGWMSPNQLQSIAFVDGLIGEIVAELENGGYWSNTLMIVTADHGGHYFGHGDDSPVDRTIPWLAVGPGVPPGITLASIINTYDTAATVLYALSLPLPEWWDGRPVMEILE
jgi:hypothetical protein